MTGRNSAYEDYQELVKLLEDADAREKWSILHNYCDDETRRQWKMLEDNVNIHHRWMSASDAIAALKMVLRRLEVYSE
jgi:hypothetical protein